jgi:ribonucleoside-diphosphate reductase alpha chain
MENSENKYRWLNKNSIQFLQGDYLLPGQTLDERVDIICETIDKILGEKNISIKVKLKDYIQRGWYSLSTPIWANFGTDRGLPISCYGSNMEDSMASILMAHAEVGMMTKLGGGTSAYFGELRGRGAPINQSGVSSGAVHFMKLFDTQMNIISQGKVRRGNFAAYLPIDHPDILEFLTIRHESSFIQDISFGVCVPDYWLQEMVDGCKEKRKVWAKVIETRANVGYPYIFFTDNANNSAPDVYKEKGFRINHSNLCSEIMLPNNEHESFVCNLASMNIMHYDEWKDTDAVEILIYLLDGVMTEFIQKAEKIPFMHRAVEFARNHRALGLGWLGWHSFLQSKMVAFESMEAKLLNVEVAKTIQEKALKASRELAQLFGKPKHLENYDRRNTTLTAIAPTKSSSFILGQVSEGIEPHKANYYIKDLAKGKFSIKNPQLKIVLKQHGKDTKEVWENILMNRGSVQHLEFLSQEEKDVFKTFEEISPKEILIQASQRQKYLDQGQSLNLMIHPKTPTKDVNQLLLEAWKMKIKALYYQMSVNAAQELSQSILQCKSCEA